MGAIGCRGLILGVNTMYMLFCFFRLFSIGCIGLSCGCSMILPEEFGDIHKAKVLVCFVYSWIVLWPRSKMHLTKSPLLWQSLPEHWWFSGRILACHAGGPGSIPGQCNFFFSFFSIPLILYTLSTRMSPESSHKLMGFYMEVLILGVIL